MPAPREVKIDVTVRATQLDDNGVRAPLVPNISLTPRPGGLTVEIDWDSAEDVPSMQQVQAWLASRVRDWSGRT